MTNTAPIERRSSRRRAYKRKSPAPVNRDDRAPPRRFRRPICSTQRCIKRAAMDGWSTSNPGCSLAPKKGWKKPWRSRPSVIRSIPLLLNASTAPTGTETVGKIGRPIVSARTGISIMPAPISPRMHITSAGRYAPYGNHAAAGDSNAELRRWQRD